METGRRRQSDAQTQTDPQVDTPCLNSSPGPSHTGRRKLPRLQESWPQSTDLNLNLRVGTAFSKTAVILNKIF